MSACHNPKNFVFFCHFLFLLGILRRLLLSFSLPVFSVSLSLPLSLSLFPSLSLFLSSLSLIIFGVFWCTSFYHHLDTICCSSYILMVFLTLSHWLFAWCSYFCIALPFSSSPICLLCHLCFERAFVFPLLSHHRSCFHPLLSVCYVYHHRPLLILSLFLGFFTLLLVYDYLTLTQSPQVDNQCYYPPLTIP